MLERWSLTYIHFIQVNIKPDVPGHTLISVYHQYPPNAPPSTGTTAETVAPKDCVPPEPIPSRARTPIEDPAANSALSSDASGNNPVSYGNLSANAPMLTPPNAGLPTPTLGAPQQMFQSALDGNEVPLAPKYAQNDNVILEPESHQKGTSDDEQIIDEEEHKPHSACLLPEPAEFSRRCSDSLPKESLCADDIQVCVSSIIKLYF